jgi:hypothetical protein
MGTGPISSGTAANAAAISTLLRAQSMATTGMKVNQQAGQAIIDQLQTNVAKNSASVQDSSGSGTLPRGSLLDMTV